MLQNYADPALITEAVGIKNNTLGPDPDFAVRNLQTVQELAKEDVAEVILGSIGQKITRDFNLTVILRKDTNIRHLMAGF